MSNGRDGGDGVGEEGGNVEDEVSIGGTTMKREEVGMEGVVVVDDQGRW